MAGQQGNSSIFLETVSDPPRWSAFFRDIFCGGLAGLLLGSWFLASALALLCGLWRCLTERPRAP